MVTPKTSKCMSTPHNSTLGLRVSRTTIRTGTKKMRSNVSEFGRFIGALQPETPRLAVKNEPRLTIDLASAGVNGSNWALDAPSVYPAINRTAQVKVAYRAFGGVL